MDQLNGGSTGRQQKLRQTARELQAQLALAGALAGAVRNAGARLQLNERQVERQKTTQVLLA